MERLLNPYAPASCLEVLYYSPQSNDCVYAGFHEDPSRGKPSLKPFLAY